MPKIFQPKSATRYTYYTSIVALEMTANFDSKVIKLTYAEVRRPTVFFAVGLLFGPLS